MAWFTGCANIPSLCLNFDLACMNSNPNDPHANPSPGWERATLEKLALSSFKEQRATRRWKVFFRLAWLSFFSVLVWLLFWYTPNLMPASVGPHTAVIEIRGVIAGGADAGAENVLPALRAAFEDPGAKAVVLLIDSPGGSPVHAGLIYDEVRRLKVLHDKKAYAVVEETCASAAYYIAAAADAIYVDKASLVGSIGVLMNGFGFTGLMEKIGVERRLLVAGENKGFLDPFSPQDAQQQVHVQSLLSDIHQQFIKAVKDGRGERLKDQDAVFSGLVWTGQEAVALGLADGLSSLDKVARDVVQAEQVVDYTERENLGLRLARQFGVSIGAGLLQAMRTDAISLR